MRVSENKELGRKFAPKKKEQEEKNYIMRNFIIYIFPKCY
jgi:hypothetical protein